MKHSLTNGQKTTDKETTMNIKNPITNAVRTAGGIVGAAGKFVDKAYKNLTDTTYKNSGITNPTKSSKKQLN